MFNRRYGLCDGIPASVNGCDWLNALALLPVGAATKIPIIIKITMTRKLFL